MLSQEEINQRLIKLRNFEQLYPELKAKYERAQEEIRSLKDQFILIKEELAAQKDLNQKLQLQVEELRVMVFGRKKKKEQPDGDDSSDHHSSSSSEKVPRSPTSFRRSKPQDLDITSTTTHPLTHCPHCQTPLTKLKNIIRYVEDMLLPTELLNIFKRVEKLIIATGFCSSCHRRVSAIPVSKQDVSLGSNVKQFISYSSIILRLSYEQIRSFLKDMVNLSISDGEISNILAEQARNLCPEYERLKETIRGQPGQHYDETSWPVQKENQGHYAWVMTGTKTPDSIFLIGRSRGQGNAQELNGTGIGISDDYGVYRKLFKVHQLCWAHPHRKLRDLAQSKALDQQIHDHCLASHKAFATIYHDLRVMLARPFNIQERTLAYQSFKERLQIVSAAHPHDPIKLSIIKEGLKKNIEAYLTCVLHDGIPADNNKAEQALRHLVIKRKTSFGSKTQRGAETTSILASTLLSLWWKRPANFFQAYSGLLDGQ